MAIKNISAREIPEFLDLYCGLEVKIDSGEFRLNGTGILRGTCAFRRALVEVQQKYLQIETIDVTLPLRDFEDITDEECLQVAKIIDGISHWSESRQIEEVKETLIGRETLDIHRSSWPQLVAFLVTNKFNVTSK